MEWVKFVFITVLITPSCFAESKQTSDSSEDVNEKNSRNPRISSEFGYNIQNSDRLSNHFRQEHRDANGVVRGSYGFKNPNGAFRLVQYVADDKGFRAHISSNENGVGKQNPASVSINRFDRPVGFREDGIDSKAPVSQLRKQSSVHKTEAQLLGHQSYLPIHDNQRTNLELPFVDDSNVFRYNVGRQEYLSTHRQNPVDKLMKTRFGIPGETISSLREKERDDALQSSPFLEPGSFSKVSPQRPVSHQYRVYPFSNPLAEIALSKKDPQATVLRKNENKLTASNYPPFLANLLHRPQHKVHTSLPDCNTVSSAVLCKPPTFFTRSLSQQKRSESDEYTIEEILRASASQLFEPEENSVQGSSFSNLYDLSSESSGMTSPHLIPNSYPLRSDVYNNFLDYIHEHSKLGHKDCHKNHLGGPSVSEDFFTPLESHKFVNDPMNNDLYNNNIKRQEITSLQNSQNKNSFKYSKDKDGEFYSSLIRIIQNDESLNKLRNMLLQPTQPSVDSGSEVESPKMSLLGVLILPSHIVKELDSKQVTKPTVKTTPANFDEKNLPVFGDDIFESDIVDESPQYLEENSRNLPEENVEENSEFENNSTLEEVKKSENKTSKFGVTLPFYLPPIKKEPSHPVINDTETPLETIKNSKFHVFDDQELSHTYTHEPQKTLNSSSNWRKVLEDEINKEIRETSLQTDDSYSGNIPDMLTDPEEAAQSNVHRYDLNKHIGPLYDSTGKLIQPENVPIHIHRFNPPSGLAPLSWKYSIPRPAPPRSIVVPPKPPTVS